MTDYYVDYATGDDTTGSGTSGAPWKTVKKATDTVTAGDHRILVSDTNDESSSGSIVLSIAAGIHLFVTAGISTTYSSRTFSFALAHSMTVNGGMLHGFVFDLSTAGTSVTFGSSDNAATILYDSKIQFTASATTSNGIFIGTTAGSLNIVSEFYNVDVDFNSEGQGFYLYSNYFRWTGGVVGGTACTNFYKTIGNRSIVCARHDGIDLSTQSGNLCLSPASTTFMMEFANCKLHASVTPMAASPAVGSDVYLYDCASGDTHYQFAHYGYNGSTVISTSVYANSGASYDGTNRHSWVVSSNANASAANPYRSPWINRYNTTLSATTFSFECVRSGSASAYNNDEVWSEWLIKTNSGSPLSSFYSDECLPLATPAAQTTGTLGASDWTGENATSWFGKLDSGSCTPAELGYLRGRICIGKASVTDLYVDPKIRV